MPDVCGAKIRPFPNDIELQCQLSRHSPFPEHQSILRDYAYPGSATTITWLDSDRRCFTGEWVECATKGCVLPNGHRGECAF